MIVTSQGLQTREGFYFPEQLSGGYVDAVLYAFSIRSNTGSFYYYVFTKESTLTTVDAITCRVYDQDWQILTETTVGQIIDSTLPVTHAINYNQVIINSPGWSTPLWAIVGSAPVQAVKVESINPDTPALNLLPGLVCSFADRFVWSYGNSIYINDPGTEPRTITTPNAIPFEGLITNLFQAGSGGELVVITSTAVYTLPPDGLVGPSYTGVVSKAAHYSTNNYLNATSVRGKVLGLTRDGLMDLRSGGVIPLIKYKRNRRLTKAAGAGFNLDCRTGSIYSFDNLAVIFFQEGAPFCVYDADQNLVYWWDSDTYTSKILGVMSSLEGRPVFVMKEAIVMLWGSELDYNSAGLALELPLDGVLSPVVREINVTCMSDGGVTVSSYVRNSLQSSTVPAPPNSIMIGTDTWTADPDSDPLLEQEFRSRRHQRAVRLDGVYLEVSVNKETIIKDVSVKLLGQAPMRPTR